MNVEESVGVWTTIAIKASLNGKCFARTVNAVKACECKCDWAVWRALLKPPRTPVRCPHRPPNNDVAREQPASQHSPGAASITLYEIYKKGANFEFR